MNDSNGLRDDIENRIQHLKDGHLYRTARTVTTYSDGTCECNGQRLVNFSGNDYLNLAHDVARSSDYLKAAGTIVGSTASALVSGRSEWHQQLERKLAEFEDTEAALLFPTGYAANLGLLTSLIQSDDVVFCDRDNHASIVDACRQSDGRLLVFRRDRLGLLEQALKNRRDTFRNAFVVVDGVYSMDGTVPDLPAIVDIADRHRAAVIVDEAHGTGVLGRHGRGACELCGVEDRVFARVGTMSKAMGGLGGFVAADQSTIDLLRNSARTQFFSTALPPAVCAAMTESLRLISEEPQRRRTLASLVQSAHSICRELNLNTIGSGPAPIVPIVIGDTSLVQQMSGELKAEGFLVPAIRPPTVKSGTDRLRLSLNIHHTENQVRRALVCVQQMLIQRPQ